MSDRIRHCIVALLLLTGLSGCSVEHARLPTSSASGRSDSQAVPSFRGPWAELFTTTWEESKTPEEKIALADGEISDQEYSYFQDQIIKCLRTKGIKAHWAEGTDLVYTPSHNSTQQDVQKCDDRGLIVLSLHDAVRFNPDNVDVNQPTVDCLKKFKLVERSYTADDYKNGKGLASLPADDKNASGCERDPLHYGKPG